MKDDKDMTSLHFACYMSELEIVQYLISKDANKDAIYKYGRTLTMHSACLNGIYLSL